MPAVECESRSMGGIKSIKTFVGQATGIINECGRRMETPFLVVVIYFIKSQLTETFNSDFLQTKEQMS